MFMNAMKDNKQPVRKSSFWGIRCESGKKYSQIVNQKYHISMAALDPTSVKNGKDVVSLLVERDGSEFLLCNLQKDSVLQVNLNLFFDKGEKVVFSLKGQGIVHLTGYLIKDDSDQSDYTLQSKKLNDSIILAKDKVKSSADAKKNVQNKKNLSTLNDSWKVESKDKCSPSPMKNNVLSKKSDSVSPSQKNPQKKLFVASQQESEDSSDDEETSDDEDEGAKRLLQIAQKRPISSSDDEEDDEDFEIDDEDLDEEDDDELSSDESEEDEELPVTKKLRNKKLKLDISTPLLGKKSAVKNVTEIINIEDDSKNGDLNSSIGRTPMPKKKPESILQKSALSDSKKAKNMDDKSSDSDDEMETSTVKETDKSKSATQMNTSSEAPNSEKKKKKKKKKKAKTDDSNPANESNVSLNDSFKAAGSGELSKAQYSKKLQGGVEYEDIRLGNGPLAKKGKMVYVYYTGKLEDNKVFDSCQPGKGKPFVFKLGAGQVIKGWDLAVEGMKVGGKRRIKIPPHMGYKNQRAGPIPPNSMLYFIVELKAVS